MVRIAEPTKICAHCKDRLPWSDFYARAKHDDGSMRSPMARCKVCHNANRAEWARSNRDRHVATQRRERARMRLDPERYERRKRAQREYGATWRRRQGIPPRAQRAVTITVDPAPFLAWMRGVMARDGLTVADVCDRFGLSERLVRGRSVMVDLATLERALIADDTCTLRDIYPDLFSEAA